MKPIVEQSLYEILEIPRDAPVAEIEKAYQRAKALYGPGSLATYSLVAPEEMALLNRRIEEAHQVLLDAGTRAGYDAGLPGGAGPAGAAVPGPAAPPEPAAAAPAQPIPAAEAPRAAAAEGTPGAGAAAAEPTVPAARAVAPAAPAPASPPQAAKSAPAQPSPPPPAAQGAPASPAPAAATKPAGFSPPEGTAWTGELLRQAREGRGLTLHQVAERTKVARHHLENVEADRYQMLPAPVYLRGILISLAKELRLDPQKVCRSYLELAQGAEGQKAPPKPR